MYRLNHTSQSGSNTFSIYPIPALNVLYAKGAALNAKYRIKKTCGELVKKGILHGYKLIVSDLPTGIYTITIIGTLGNFNCTFIKY